MEMGREYSDEVHSVEGDWGLSSEIGKLKSVFMRRPGHEVEGVTDAQLASWRSIIDPEKVRAQHDKVVSIYKENDINVYMIDKMDPNCHCGFFCRDQIIGTPEGAILARMGLKVRVNEVKYVEKKLAQLKVPIIRAIHGRGVFEGACIEFIDRKTAIIGIGLRSNDSGFQQVADILRTMGVKNIIKVDIARNQNHLDGFLGIADYETAVTYPYITPNVIYDELEKRGFRFIEVPTFEEKINFACNFVTLEPGKILMSAGTPRTRDLLIDAGVKVIEVNIDEIKKGGGGLHCITGVLSREEIPIYLIKN